MKYKFLSYYKYGFVLELENGKVITNENQNSDDIYRLSISAEGEAKESGEGYLIDGYYFV